MPPKPPSQQPSENSEKPAEPGHSKASSQNQAQCANGKANEPVPTHREEANKPASEWQQATKPLIHAPGPLMRAKTNNRVPASKQKCHPDRSEAKWRDLQCAR